MATTAQVKSGARAVYNDVKDLGYALATWETTPSNWFDSKWTGLTYTLGLNAVYLDFSLFLANQVQNRGFNLEDLCLYSIGAATPVLGYYLNRGRGVRGVGIGPFIEKQRTEIEARTGTKNVWLNLAKRFGKGAAVLGAVGALWHYGNNLKNDAEDESLYEATTEAVSKAWNKVF